MTRSKFAFISFGVGLLSFSASLFAEDTGSSFSLSVSSPSSAYAQGADIGIDIALTNTSKKSIAFNDTTPACDYSINVRDAEGAPVPRTKLGQDVDAERGCTTFIAIRNMPVSLNPGHVDIEGLSLSQLFEISKPGTYLIRVRREIGSERERCSTQSNEIEITISAAN